MKKFLLQVMVMLLAVTANAATDFQLPDPHFEDWSGSTFDGNIQPKNWHGSNVEQSAIGITFRFNFMFRETGRTGYCAMTKGLEVGAAGITENAPGYFSLAEAWQYLKGLDTNSATAGSKGGIKFDHRPDSVAVWIKRTGPATDKEDFHILFYSWQGDSKGKKYLNKAGACTETPDYIINEESDVRQVLDGNECGTSIQAKQVAEGWLKARTTYSNWTRICIPVFYMNDEVPTNCNMLFSASNYPNFRANDGLYVNNALYVDDVELIYSSKIQELWVGGKKWNAFDPNSTDVQVYSLGTNATSIPSIEAWRGVGTLTTKGDGYDRKSKFTKTHNFPGRKLQGSEINVSLGDLEGKETTITVTAEDGSSTTTYRILFQRAESDNAKLAGISYALGNDTIALSDFSLGKNNYNVELPYGTTETPKVLYTLAEEKQTVVETQATSPTGKATLVVTSPSKKYKETYTVQFSIGLLKDNTLKSILVNGKPIPGFSPAQTVYKVSVQSDEMPEVEAVSAYPKGEQTITYKAPDVVDGGQYQISVSTPGNTTPKVYKLNFKKEASSYSRLANLQVVGDKIANVNPAKQGDPTALAFDPDYTTYYVNLMMGAKELPQIIPTKGEDTQTIEVLSLEPGIVDGTVKVIVTAGNGTDKTVYKLVFSAEKSEITTLAGINIAGVPLEGFDPEITEYHYVLPIGTTMETFPTVEPIAHDEFQTISITAPTSVNGKMRISVTAGNGNTKNYYISFEVLQYKDNTLKSLSVGPGYSLQDENYQPIAFDPQRNDYWVKLTSDSIPTVTYEAQDERYQTIDPYPTTSPNGKYKISVRPLNGASRTYTIKFVYELSGNTALQMIYVNDTVKGTVTPLPDFQPEVTDYTFTLDTGRVDMPDVTYDKAEAGQQVAVKWDANNKRIVRLTVTAENGDKRTYKLKFMVPSAASTQLDSIYLVEGNDTMKFEAFRKDQYEYTYQFDGETCPKIIAYKGAPEQQVTITSPYAAGTATILVEMEESNSQYTIEFVKKPASAVQLTAIRYDGKDIENFDPATMHYEVTLANNELPTVEGIGTDMTVNVLWKGNTAYLHVTHEDQKAIYSVTFIRTLSGDNTLKAIYADGGLIPGFSTAILDYSYDLPAGSAYPTISYLASDPAAQVLFFGQLEPGKWGITVLAENGEQTTYTVQYNIAQFSNATLAGLSIDPVALTPAFDANTFAYTATIEDGASLPELIALPKDGQTIMQSNVDERHQQVTVFAENGATATYTITYTRVESNNALLADILIDGVSLEGFNPYVTNYTDSLEINTTVVPNVFPIGQLPNQTITTYFSRPNGVTKIHVVAQNGATKDYFVAFPVKKSNNTKLGDLYLTSEDAEIRFRQDVTDYEVILPYEATECPKMVYEQDEASQRIDVISRPIGETTQIIVTAENGDTRTYNILFKRAVLKTRNLLSMIRITELGKELSLKDKNQRAFEVEMPYGSRSMTVEYEKSYDEQTVFIEPGGVKRPTVITVKANNDTVADEVYTITPIVPTQHPAVLESITINGKALAGFDKNIFSYIVKLDTKEFEDPIVLPVALGSAIATPTITNHKHWQCVVSKDGLMNTYNLWFYYTNDKVPNAEFNEFVGAENGKGGTKPKDWHCLADYFTDYSAFASGTHTFGKNGEVEEVTINGSKGVKLNSKKSGGNALSSIYGGALGGILPAWIALDEIDGSLQEAGGSTFWMKNPGGGIIFRNTPDIMRVYAKTGAVCNNNRIVYQLSGNGNSSLVFSTEANTEKVYSFDLAQANKFVTAPTQLNIILNSFFKESMSTLTQGSDADLTVDYLRFTYNHTLTNLQVEGGTVTKNGNAFTAQLEDPEQVELPVLKFTGEVNDQAQEVKWQTPKKEGDFEVRKATIRNWAENGTDYTDYTLTVNRKLDTKNQLTNLLVDNKPVTGFAANKYQYEVTLPSSQRNLPDIVPVPASSLQTIKTAYDETNSTMTITVTPEKGETKTYTVTFKTKLSSDVTLANIAAEGVNFAPDTLHYDVTADRLPLISFDKQSDLQTVVLNNGVLTVTAEDGTKGTYTINRIDPVISPNGTIAEFEIKGDILTDFGGDVTEKTATRPTEYIDFTRAQFTDSVIFVQAPTQMTWSVPTTPKTYVWRYPTSKSDNAALQMITVNDTNYEYFMPTELNYELIADSTIVLAAIGADDKQTIETSYEPIAGGVLYTAKVTAENGENTSTYTVKITRPMSSLATLKGISLDKVLLTDFAPEKTNYVYTIPAPQGAKTAQPKMPNVTYEVGHEGQQVTIQAGRLNEEETTIQVTSEDGTMEMYYTLAIKAEASHCSDLTGILVNGEALDHFEAGRHFYSVSLKTDEIDIDYTSEDRFQTVETREGVISAGHHYSDTLRVTAEDGSHSDYIIEIYVENQSNDAQLANILFDGKPMDKFDSDLHFDGGNNNYVIALKGGKALPEVSAQLKMDGQQVEIEHQHEEKTDIFLLHVTAVDGITTNTYVLRFNKQKSDNSLAQEIETGNVVIEGFDPYQTFYSFDLKYGESTPRINVTPQDENATYEIIDTEESSGRVIKTVVVMAEDYEEDANHKTTYTLVFYRKLSTKATLDYILANRDTLKGYDPEIFYYTDTLPVGSTYFPDLYWPNDEEYPIVTMDTVENDTVAKVLVRQLTVTAQDPTYVNHYTVSFKISKSDNDRLMGIEIEDNELKNFDPEILEYKYRPLTAKEAAELNGQYLSIKPIRGDEWQKIHVDTLMDNSVDKTLGYKYAVTVTSESGNHSRTYTVQFPVELSSDATPAEIRYGNGRLAGWDPDKDTYIIEVGLDEQIQVISVVKREEAQTYEIIPEGDDVYKVLVTAEDGTQMTYTLKFDRVKSGVATLSNIIILENGKQLPYDLFFFNPDVEDYTIVMPYDAARTSYELPDITLIPADTLQTIDTVINALSEVKKEVVYTVTAPNGEDEKTYKLTIFFTRNNDAALISVTIADEKYTFSETKYTETIFLPFGTESLYTTEDISAIVTSDPLATNEVTMDEEGTFTIHVTAQDETTDRTYTIYQELGKDTLNTLDMIYLDDAELEHFEPTNTDVYVYKLRSGAGIPNIRVLPSSETVTIETNSEEQEDGTFAILHKNQPGDTVTIECSAENGDIRTYRIYFEVSGINYGRPHPSENDVFLRRYGKSQVFVATINSDVTFILYDQAGRLISSNKVPVADPNDIEAAKYAQRDSESDGGDRKDVLLDVVDISCGLLININPGQIYFYSFMSGGGNFKSGKIIAMP